MIMSVIGILFCVVASFIFGFYRCIKYFERINKYLNEFDDVPRNDYYKFKDWVTKTCGCKIGNIMDTCFRFGYNEHEKENEKQTKG